MHLFKVFCLLGLLFVVDLHAQADEVNHLIGTWRIDLTPHNTNDNNVAVMKIDKIKGNKLFGEFYRKGVRIQNGIINSNHQVHAALISADNSGKYNSSFYLKDGILYGTTHAVDRDFLSVWVAVKE